MLTEIGDGVPLDATGETSPTPAWVKPQSRRMALCVGLFIHQSTVLAAVEAGTSMYMTSPDFESGVNPASFIRCSGVLPSVPVCRSRRCRACR